MIMCRLWEDYSDHLPMNVSLGLKGSGTSERHLIPRLKWKNEYVSCYTEKLQRLIDVKENNHDLIEKGVTSDLLKGL